MKYFIWKKILEKTDFISPKKTLPKPGFFRINKENYKLQIDSIFLVHVQDAMVSWVVWMAPAIEP